MMLTIRVIGHRQVGISTKADFKIYLHGIRKGKWSYKYNIQGLTNVIIWISCKIGLIIRHVARV